MVALLSVPDRVAAGKRATDRLLADMAAARKSWAIFEALNGNDPTHRKAMVDQAKKRGLGSVLNGLALALGRDTLMTLFRMTDPPNSDRLTLCTLSKLLSDPLLRTDREAEARNWLPWSSEAQDRDAEIQRAAMQFIVDLVPPSWTGARPADPRVFDLRSKLGPMRNAVLAHSMDTTGVQMPIVNEIREFVELTSNLMQRAQLVFRGSASSGKDDFKGRLAEANEFWDLCQNGFVDASD